MLRERPASLIPLMKNKKKKNEKKERKKEKKKERE